MPLHEVQDQIEKIRRRANRFYKDTDLSLTEIATRYYFIDPILRSLGWKLEDPNHVQYEAWRSDWGRVDYELYVSGELVALLEAKSLGKLWSDYRYEESEEQLKEYAWRKTTGVSILTDGDSWCIWDLTTKRRKPEVVCITEDTIEHCARTLLRLLRRRRKGWSGLDHL